MYTDDVLLAKNEKNAELKEMLKRSKNFGKEKVKHKYEQIKDNGIRKRKGKNEEERMKMGKRKNRDQKNKIFGVCATKEWRSGEAYKRKHKGKAHKRKEGEQ